MVGMRRLRLLSRDKLIRCDLLPCGLCIGGKGYARFVTFPSQCGLDRAGCGLVCHFRFQIEGKDELTSGAAKSWLAAADQIIGNAIRGIATGALDNHVFVRCSR